jgi:hypothetical protein
MSHANVDEITKAREAVYTRLRSENAAYFNTLEWRTKQLQIAFDALPNETIAALVGTVWMQGENGTLTAVNVAPGWLKARACDIARFGPQYLDAGGGSRLPRAEGTLYVTSNADRAALLTALGIAPDKHADYAQVTVQPVADTNEMLRIYETKQQAGANIRYLADVRVDNVDVTVVYTSDVAVARSLRAKFRAAGRNYDETFADADANALQQAFAALAAPAASGWVAGTEIGPESRGEGQTVAMGNWNALGVAAYLKKVAGTALNLDQNWEWLHVRAASCGGKTAAGNLMAGPFVANSLMIPYESLIKKWAGEDPTKVWFNFEPVNVNGPVADGVRVKVRSNGHMTLGTTNEFVLIEINVLAGRVVDKLAGEMIARGRDKSVVVED